MTYSNTNDTPPKPKKSYHDQIMMTAAQLKASTDKNGDDTPTEVLM
jgi:hypothetical protein